MDVPPSKGLQSQNVQFKRGGPNLQVGTRLGFSIAFVSTDGMSALFNWISDLGNYLFWYKTDDRSVQYINVVSQPSPQVVAIAGDLIGVAATFSPAGARLVVSFFNSAGVGASGTQIITYSSGSFVHDLAFQPPITYVPPAPTEPVGVGVVTAGLHLFGYLIQYRSGFITRPSPDSGAGTVPDINTYTPISFTASGGKSLTWSLTTTWPVGAVSVLPIMTTVSDLSEWFIPQGLSQPVVGGVSSTVTFNINISDDILTATGQAVTDSLDLLTNSVLNVPNILPSASFTHGNRMVYITTIADGLGGTASALFISDIGKYQQISADRSLIQLPGLRSIVAGISMDGVLYIFGPQWTYQTIDNQGDPVTWATPQLVDGSRGTLSVRGVQVAPSGTYAWVAAQDGLYFFQAVFPALPISYYQDTFWNRINWNVAQAVQIRDIPHLRKVQVMACLDSDTTPTAMLTWDYTEGFSPQTDNFSFDFLQSYNMGTFEAVKNGLPNQVTAASQQQELWLGSSNGGGVLRGNQSTDTNPYLDVIYPIFSTYETGLFPEVESQNGEIFQHHGADYRLTGDGEVQITAYTMDHAQNFQLLPISLSTSPGLMPHRGFNAISEGVSHLITQGQNLVTDGEFDGT